LPVTTALEFNGMPYSITVDGLRRQVNSLFIHTKNNLTAKSMLDEGQALSDRQGHPIGHAECAAVKRNVLANIRAADEQVSRLTGALQASVDVLKGALHPDLAVLQYPGDPVLAAACGMRKSGEVLDLFEDDSNTKQRAQDAKGFIAEIMLDHLSPLHEMERDLGCLEGSLESNTFSGVPAEWQKSVDALVGFVRKKYATGVYSLSNQLWSV
jgi:hypothetical protein